MPNQRSKNKVYLGGFLEKGLHKQIVQSAKQAGMAHNKFGFVVQLIQESLERRQRKKTKLRAPRSPATAKASPPAKRAR